MRREPVGRLTPAEVPGRLAEVAAQYGVTWIRSLEKVRGLEGHAFTAGLVAWLFGR